MSQQTLKLVLVPVATIGCGKTTTALILKHLFPNQVGVVSNDDVPNGKKGPKVFVQMCHDLLLQNSIVIMDRNNHMFREREQIFNDFKQLLDATGDVNVRFICLNYLPQQDSRSRDLWDITTGRVVARGDNHQSIKAITDGDQVVRKIMGGFVSRFQRVNTERHPDSLFDLCIDLKVTNKQDSSLENAQVVYDTLAEQYPTLLEQVPKPTESQWSDAFTESLGFTPTYHKTFGKTSSQKVETTGQQQDIVHMLKQAKSQS